VQIWIVHCKRKRPSFLFPHRDIRNIRNIYKHTMKRPVKTRQIKHQRNHQRFQTHNTARKRQKRARTLGENTSIRVYIRTSRMFCLKRVIFLVWSKMHFSRRKICGFRNEQSFKKVEGELWNNGLHKIDSLVTILLVWIYKDCFNLRNFFIGN